MKHSLRHIATILPILILSLLIFATPVSANTILIGVVYLYFSGRLGWGAAAILSLVVLTVEACVFWWKLPVPLMRAVWISIAINLISIAVGYCLRVIIVFPAIAILRGIGGPLLVLALLSIVVYFIARATRLPVWVHVGFVVGLLLGLIPYEMSEDLRFNVGFFLALVSAFGITLYIESLAIGSMSKSKNYFNAVLIANLISYALIFAVLLINGPAHRWYPGGCGRYQAWDMRAKSTLRSIGSAQISYRNSNYKHVYGSLEDLQYVGEVADGYSLANMIENYSLSWEVSNIPISTIDDAPTDFDSTFTIIAYPRDLRPGFLATFAITEDQILREYDPRDNELDAVRSWDPIL